MKKPLLPVILFAFVALVATPALAQRGGGGGGGGGNGGGRGNQNQGQATPSPDGTRIPLWICNSPGGTYEVALRSMVSVSTCEYIVDGVARVTEVDVDTTGNMCVRFYYLEPVVATSPIGLGQSAVDKAQELAQQVADRTGQDAWKKVVKNYPTSTHAHTIEYRVDSKDDLMKIFTSAETAFRTATPATLSVGETSDNSPNTNPVNN